MSRVSSQEKSTVLQKFENSFMTKLTTDGTDSRQELAILAGSQLHITGKLKPGRNGNSGNLVMRNFQLTVEGDGQNTHGELLAEPLPTGTLEHTVPDSVFSLGLTPGKMVSPDGVVESEFFKKLPANTCVILKGKGDGQKVGKVILAIKKDEMLRIVPRPKAEVGESHFVRPKSNEQAFAFDMIADPEIKFTALYGPAGTGKTVTAIAAGLKILSGLNMSGQTVLDGDRVYGSNTDNNPCHVLVVRPVCPIGNDLGSLPGDREEKIDPWAQAIQDAGHYISVCTGDTDLSKSVEVTTVTHMRGRTLNKELVVIDDAQNFRPEDMLTLLTRIASTSKVVITGDPDQIDARGLSVHCNGLDHVIRRLIGWERFACVKLVKNLRCPDAAEVAERLKV